ncbi:hypothetical protein H0H92_005287 [Tricholoma furcatifolium]|nr:hypothetical protein H0H92_005287 [Tricholoma furcatifolium]
MVGSPNAGQVHELPAHELELPLGKKARLAGKGGHKKESKRSKRRRERTSDLPELCSSEDVLWRDVIAVLGKDVVDKAMEDGAQFDSPLKFHDEVEVEVEIPPCEAIARLPNEERPWAIILPFALPGEKVKARIYRNSRLHSFADLLEVITPNSQLRDDSRVRCQYFGTCGGCQYQMLSYETQLELKRDVVVKAYKNFSGTYLVIFAKSPGLIRQVDLAESSIPSIQSTIGSPLQYEYRTKLTPHFEAPPKSAKKNQASEGKPEWLKIGFNRVGTSKTMDIEECPIATKVINDAYRPARENITKNIHTYKRGVSLLYRDSLPPRSTPSGETEGPADDLSASLEHVCITDQKATARERVGDFIFAYVAGSFFQNNNSVLVPLTSYVRDAIFPASASSGMITTDSDAPQPTHLVDAYCGAGLFAITLSPYFQTIAGIELSEDSIKAAKNNAELNKIPQEKISFRAGDAADIFKTVGEFPPEKTALLIDPPRKGCDDNFIQQLLQFGAKTVVYVSCNVHTQARDVGKILKATENEVAGRKYVLESVRGFDLFPQTAHVESVAVLRLV